MASQQPPDEVLALQQALNQARTAADFQAVVDQVFASSLGIIHTRTLLTALLNALRAQSDDELVIAVLTHTLTILAASPTASSSFAEQSAALRTLLADAHEATEDFRAAARALSEIPLDTSQRRVSDADKCRVWVRIVRLYLEEDEPTLAETYLNKVKNVIHAISSGTAADNAAYDPDTLLHFRLSAARISDAKRQFLSASQAYHEISLMPQVEEDDRLRTLAEAIKCAILAPAGPTRSRALARLYKDERAAGLEQFAMLEKMFLERLIDPAEVDKFAQSLQAHQLATTADGSTVLARAMVDHNLLAASRLYVNIGFEALGLQLGLDGKKAEETTAKMIEQGRLKGTIDQIDQCIWFEDDGEAHGTGPIQHWDNQVLGVAEEVENVVGLMQQEIPAFVAQNMVV